MSWRYDTPVALSAVASALAILGGGTAAVAAQDTEPGFSSGTSWVPASGPMMPGVRFVLGGWSGMLHGTASLNAIRSGGPRGDDQTFVTNMAGLTVGRCDGRVRWRFKAMVSLEPTMGPRGYPLLLQTGETADGQIGLVDRQHPHDLFMELSAKYTHPIGPAEDLFIYVAPVGEPALGPGAFMHRGSGRDLPAAPITHHFLDGTHITYGVITAGVTSEHRLKIDVSLFNGSEPDQNRWDIERPRFDSYSLRATYQPHPNISMQFSVAELRSPEQLHPGLDLTTLSVSGTYNRPLPNGHWQTTLAFGRNKTKRTVINLAEARRTFPAAILAHYVSLNQLDQLGGLPEDSVGILFPSRVTVGLLLETTVRHGPLTGFLRAEAARKNELLPPTDIRHSEAFWVAKTGVGGIVDVMVPGMGRFGIGAAGFLNGVDRAIRPEYGGSPVSGLLFSRVQLGR